MLDTAIDEAAETLMQYYGIEELGDPGVQSQVRRSLLSLAHKADACTAGGHYRRWKALLGIR